MNTTHNPDGTVTVTSRGHHRLSELLDVAALAFAHKRETAVDWPALVATAELGADHFASTFALADSGRSSASAAPTFEPEPRPRRYDQCDGTCTVDCGHCKGAGRPAYALTAV